MDFPIEKPLPSSKFFFTLSLTLAGTFLASAGSQNFPPEQEFKEPKITSPANKNDILFGIFWAL